MKGRRLIGAVALTCLTAGIGMADRGASAAPRGSDVVEGTLSIAMADSFTSQASSPLFFVDPGGGRPLVQLEARPAQQLEMRKLAYRRVRIRGRRLGRRFRAEAVAATGPATAAALAPQALAAGPMQPQIKIAVIMLRNKDKTNVNPVTSAELNNTVFGAQGSVAAYYRETSNGAVTVTGRVFGPYDSEIDSQTCDVGSWFSEAQRLAAADGYNTTDYNHDIVFAPPRQACPWAGIGWMGPWGAPPQRAVAVNGWNVTNIFAHEMGHNFGLAHAAVDICERPPESAVFCNYDDPNDVMGNKGMRHFQAWNKVHLGFLPAENVLTLNTPGAQTVALTNSEVPVSGATQLLMLPHAGGKQYGIEARQSSGSFDAGLCACVWLRVITPVGPGEFAKNTGLVDVVPGPGPDDLDDAQLANGATFRDAESGVTITNLGMANGVAQLRVTIDGVPPTTTTSTSTTTTTKPPTTTTSTSTTTTTKPPTTTTSTSTTTTTLPKPAARVELQGSTLKFSDPVGRDDHVTVTEPSYHVYQVDDPGVPLTAGPGCTVVGAAVQCKAAVKFADLDLGGGNDTARVDERLTTTYRGGAGNDTFVVNNTAHHDQFLGGTGVDTVDYSDRYATHASVDGLANDGTTVEDDNIATDVENLVTGRGIDTIMGGPGHNSIISGAGNDKIDVKDGVADDVDCGTGSTDKVTADLIDRLVNCERVTRS